MSNNIYGNGNQCQTIFAMQVNKDFEFLKGHQNKIVLKKHQECEGGEGERQEILAIYHKIKINKKQLVESAIILGKNLLRGM